MAATLSPTDAPAAPPASPNVSTRQRTPRLRWLVAVVVVLLAALGTGLGLLLNYQPLTRGSIGWALPEGVGARVSTVEWVGPDEGARIFKIPAAEGLTFTYRVSITNRGPMPVTIHSVGVPPDDLAPITYVVVPFRMNLDINNGATERGWEPFGPFELGANEEASVELRVSVRDCMLEGTGASWNTQPFVYEVLGLPRKDSVTLPVQITLLGTQARC
jgi:hypothetical protein